MSYVQAMRLFYEQYLYLSDTDKNNFSRIVHKLLSVNYLTNQKEADLKDYYFITSHYDLFKVYFQTMDCDLTIDTSNRIIFLSSNEGYNRYNLKLNESIILLILRLLYDEKMREVSLVNKVMISLDDIHEKFLSIGLKDRRMSKTELKQILTLFKKYNLIDILDNDFKDDSTRLFLYPSLLYAVHIEDINEIYDKIMTYTKEGNQDEEISTD